MDDDDSDAAELSRGKTPQLIADCAACINGSIQEVADQAPHLFKQNSGGVLKAPTTATGISATAGSTVISGFSAYAADMRGCTIRLDGDSYDNEIVSATEVARPYLGPTSSGLSANIYYDCIPLASTVSSVVEPVMIPSLGKVWLADSRHSFLTGEPRMGNDRHYPYPAVFPFSANFQKMVGRPSRWMCEERYDSTSGSTLLLMRFYPMPNQLFGVVFEVTAKPPTYTAADIDSDDGGTDPATVIPFPWVESRLMPIVTKRWMKHPSFNQSEASQQAIMADYSLALASLEKEKPTRGYRQAQYH